MIVSEDNQSTITVAEKGASKQLRHLRRTHRVNLAWISEVLSAPEIQILYVTSFMQSVDIFTKSATSPDRFRAMCMLVGISDGHPHLRKISQLRRAQTVAFCLSAFPAARAPCRAGCDVGKRRCEPRQTADHAENTDKKKLAVIEEMYDPWEETQDAPPMTPATQSRPKPPPPMMAVYARPVPAPRRPSSTLRPHPRQSSERVDAEV